MRTCLVLICSLALASVAPGAEEENGKKKEEPRKKAAHAGQVSQPDGKTAGKPTTAGEPAEVGKSTGVGKPVTAGGPAGKKFQAQHFSLQTKPSPTIASTTFQANR